MTTEIVAPPTRLRYTITPTSVPMGLQRQRFMLTVSNPGPNTVSLKSGNGIQLENLSELTATTISPVNLPEGWDKASGEDKSDMLFYVSDAEVEIAEGDYLLFQFDVDVVAKEGTAALAVAEIFGGAKIPPRFFLEPIQITPNLRITAWADPVDFGPGEKVNLRWTTIGGQYVTVKPGPDTRYKVKKGDEENLLTVLPDQEQSQTTYTLTVYEGNKTFAERVTVSRAAPQIASFALSPSIDVAFDDEVEASWKVRRAAELALISPSGAAQDVSKQSSRMLSSISRFLPPNGSSVRYTLTAKGYYDPDSSVSEVTFAPVEIKYLRCGVGPAETRTVEFEVFNAQPGTALTFKDSRYVLKAVGPGGPKTEELPLPATPKA